MGFKNLCIGDNVPLYYCKRTTGDTDINNHINTK